MENQNWKTKKKYRDVITALTKLRQDVPASIHKAQIDDLIAQFEMVIDAIESHPNVFGKIFAGHRGMAVCECCQEPEHLCECLGPKGVRS